LAKLAATAILAKIAKICTVFSRGGVIYVQEILGNSGKKYSLSPNLPSEFYSALSPYIHRRHRRRRFYTAAAITSN